MSKSKFIRVLLRQILRLCCSRSPPRRWLCNFTNHMYAVCAHLLSAQHLPFEAMLPLIDETARKVHHLSPVEAQTGPACRYDVNVIERHLEMLASEPELAAMYEQISKNIHNYTISKNQKP